jgi:hypothetical protein
MRFTADPDRSKLGFVDSALLAFGFLEADFGFHVVGVEEPTFVRYESPTGFVNVFHTRGGYRVGADIGRFITTKQGERQEDRVTLFEIVNTNGDHEAGQRLDIPAESAAEVSAAVNYAAQLVCSHASELLLGQAEAYSRIAEYRRAANERHSEKGAQLWKVRQAAHAAWNRGDRQEAIRLLHELPGLTEHERRMLGWQTKTS